MSADAGYQVQESRREMSGRLRWRELVARVPPPWPGDPVPEIRRLLAARGERVVIIADDPNPSFALPGALALRADDETALAAAFAPGMPPLFLDAADRNGPPRRSSASPAGRRAEAEVFRATVRAAAGSRALAVIAANDGTLRGALPDTELLGDHGQLLLMPLVDERGLITFEDVHFLRDGAELIPGHDAPFGRDDETGYPSAHLPAWVEDRTAGRIRRAQVATLDLATIRLGPEAVSARIVASDAPVIAANGLERRDAEVVALGAMLAEAAGRRLLPCTGASFAAARAGLRAGPPLDPAALASTAAGGLIVACGSSAADRGALERLRAGIPVRAIGLGRAEATDGRRGRSSTGRAVAEVERALADGQAVLVTLDGASAPGGEAGALAEILRGPALRPRFVLTAGTPAHAVVARELGILEAEIRGALLPGVPLWSLDGGSRFPGLPYASVPGGDARLLAEAVARLQP